jgi:anthranilate phosphoribosyltransferase
LIRALLEGEQGPRRDIVVANAAAALLLAQHAPDLKSAVGLAAESIDSGAALRKLEQVIAFPARANYEVV